MRFRHPAWVPALWLLSLGNLAAVWFAARPAEPWHATAHALLAVAFGLAAERLRARAGLAAEGDLVGRVQDLEAQLAEVDKVPALEGRLAELEERLDFTERALVELRSRTQLPAGEQPRGGE